MLGTKVSLLLLWLPIVVLVENANTFTQNYLGK